MVEESTKEEVKEQPVKEEPKKNTVTFVIDLDALDQPVNIPVPPNQDVWHKEGDISEDYQKLMNTLGIIMVYVARMCNEGPEIIDNPAKRIITIKTLLTLFFENLNINGYMAYGLLTELLHDTYMKISGTQQTISLLKHIQQRAEKKAKEKSKVYVS